MTLSDLERLAREAIASKGKWRMDILLTEEELALWEAAGPEVVASLLRVVRAAVEWGKIRHRSAADDEPLYQALAALNLKDET